MTPYPGEMKNKAEIFMNICLNITNNNQKFTQTFLFADTSWMRGTVLFRCDCERMLEFPGILHCKQGGRKPERQFLAEGELTACPHGTKTGQAEYLEILTFWNRNSETELSLSSSVRSKHLHFPLSFQQLLINIPFRNSPVLRCQLHRFLPPCSLPPPI